MQIRTSRLCTFTLISLLSLFGFAAQAGAQDNIFNQLGGSPKSRGKTGNAHKAKIAAPASGYSYSVLYTFCSVPPYCADGKNPFAGLIQDAAGNLYGTTEGAGGTVFKMDNTGHETVLYSFCSVVGKYCTDGSSPTGGLIQDAAGNLYGTTSLGGGNNNGTVFIVNSTGQETVLHSFCPAGGYPCMDGGCPTLA